MNQNQLLWEVKKDLCRSCGQSVKTLSVRVGNSGWGTIDAATARRLAQSLVKFADALEAQS